MKTQPRTAALQLLTGLVMIGALAGDPAALHAASMRLFGTQFQANGNLYVLDPSTGAGATIGNTSSFLQGLDLRNNGVMYAASTSLKTVNISTAVTSVIGPLAESMSGIAFSPNDELYALNSLGSKLYKLDPATGNTLSTVSLSGTFFPNELNGIDFAPNGTLYGVGAALYTINLLTGGTTRITPQNLVSLDGGSGIFNDMDYGSDGFIRAIRFDSQHLNSLLFTIDPATGLGISSLPTQLDLHGLASVPQPSNLVLAAGGFLGVALALRRSRLQRRSAQADR